MTEHDLSALDGLLDELDIVEKGDQDPRAAKLKALFEHAKATYTAKIDAPTWYIPSTGPTPSFDISTFSVPNPTELLAQRKKDRTGTTNQEWTSNYLYTEGYFEQCLSYAVSFALSMGVTFPFGEEGRKSKEGEYDSSQMALRRTKAEREMSKNWGVVKDVIDAGIRSLLTLLRSTSASTFSIETWIPTSTGSKTYNLGTVDLNVLARGFLAFSMREIRVGAGDSRSGYSGMVIPSASSDSSFLPKVDMDKVRLQNWTVTHGLALTAGDLALELGLYRTAIEAHTLFLACRGQMWRVLLSLAHELSSYSTLLRSENRAKEQSLKALEVVAKASVVAALQAVPRPRRVELARVVIVECRVIPAQWIEEALKEGHEESTVFEDEDQLLFNGLLQPTIGQEGNHWLVVPEEIGIALVKVVFAKKSGLFAIHAKFTTYIKEYKGRLDALVANSNQNGDDWCGELEAAEEEETEGGPRSVRTL